MKLLSMSLHGLKIEKLCCVVPDNSRSRLLSEESTFTLEEEMKVYHVYQRKIDKTVVKELTDIVDLLKKIKDRDLSETISNIQELCKLFPESVN